MSSTKRVSGNYNIYADNTIVNGNLTVMGTQTSVETTDTLIQDRFVTLNAGELGAGVTGGSPPSAGIEVDRGSNPNVYIRYNESTTKWEITNDGSTYAVIATGSTSIAGSDTQVQFNDGGSGFGADSAFTFNKTTKTLTLGNITLQNSTISTVSTNGDLTIDPNGTGRIILNAAMKLANQGSDPIASSGNNYVYSKTPASGGSGVFFVNTSYSDELVSKKKARKFALIF